MTLEQLKEEERALRHKLSENKAKQDEIMTKAFTDKWGFKVGDAVEWMDGNIQRKGVISTIKRNQEYYAKLFLKNGTPGNREVRVWTWSYETMKHFKP